MTEAVAPPVRPSPSRPPEMSRPAIPEAPTAGAQVLANSLETAVAARQPSQLLIERLAAQQAQIGNEAIKPPAAQPATAPETAGTSKVSGDSTSTTETASAPAIPLSEHTQAPDASQEYVDRYIQQGIQSWEQQHPEPDSSENPTEYSKWAHARIEIRAKLAIDAKVGQDLQAWEKDNPRPDKEKDPKAFEAWLEKRLEQESTSRGKHASNEQQNAPESSEAEILVKANRLRELYMQRANLAEGIALLNSKASKTNEESQKLNALRIQKDQMDNVIGLLEKELIGQARRSPLKAGIITMAIMGGLIATLASRGSKG